MAKKYNIPQDVLDRYVSGQATLEEIALVSMAVKEDPELGELVEVLENLHKSGFLDGNAGEIPMASMAAMSEGNLCDVMCEQYILKDYLGKDAAENLVSEAMDNCWLKESGTPLHNMGRLLEKNGMSVSRKYDCSIDEMANLLNSRCKLIAVVDYGQLWSKEADGIFHAVVCINIIDGIIRIYDPAVEGYGNYTVEDFAKAWNYSKNYLVVASAASLEYVPHPIDVTGVELDEELMELTESIAENAHEVWASKRRNEGWSYGPKRDDVLKEHPDMVPYSELPESEKYYDRDMAMNTIRLVRKLGFNISRKYTRYCPHCGEFVSDSMKFCPECGGRIGDNQSENR